MKSFYKISFIIAGCLIAVGLIFGLVGAAFGGNRQLHDMIRSGELSYRPNLWFDLDDWWDDDDYFDEDEYTSTISSEVTGNYPAEGIKKLDIDIGAAELNIHPYTGTEYQLSITHPEKFEYGMKDSDTFYIRSKGTDRNGFRHKQVDIFVPENTKLESIALNVGAGVINAEELVCDELDIQVGAGEFNGDKIMAKEVTCEIGAGTVKMSDAAISESDFKIGVGSAYVSGKISGDTDIDCAMGSVELDLEGDVKDYNFEVSCSAGHVDIDGETINAVSGSKRINNNSDVTFEIECSMGNVEIDF